MERLELLDVIDEARQAGEFLRLEETLALRSRGIIIYDPFSTLISRHVQIASGNLFYPNTILHADAGSHFEVGSDNVFYPATFMAAVSGGSLVIGSRNTFGDGGFRAMANRADARIAIGNGGRYNSGASVYGGSALGNGTQVLGAISVSDCVLDGGRDFTDPDPDSRGAVLKGFGAAARLHLRIGEVIFGKGSFEPSAIQRQTDFHPKPPAAA